MSAVFDHEAEELRLTTCQRAFSPRIFNVDAINGALSSTTANSSKVNKVFKASTRKQYKGRFSQMFAILNQSPAARVPSA